MKYKEQLKIWGFPKSEIDFILECINNHNPDMPTLSKSVPFRPEISEDNLDKIKHDWLNIYIESNRKPEVAKYE